MARRILRTTLLAVTLITAARFAALSVKASAATGLSVYPLRQSPDDLEITGIAGQPREYLRYADLTRLPQVVKTINGGPDFNNVTMTISGITLETLQKTLGVPVSSDLIDALCSDNYRSQLPADYIAEHHPILVLAVDGLKPAAWAVKAHQDDPGPYFIAYASFVPAFHVLAHADQPALPTNVVRINFSTRSKTFGPITPPAAFVSNEQVQQGFTIAKQNCMRCHFQGSVGGTKSGRDWLALSRRAHDEPDYFARYTLNPKSVNRHAQMPGNPHYDAATAAALTAYFRTFSETPPAGKGSPKP